jgi:hypothetical protein
MIDARKWLRKDIGAEFEDAELGDARRRNRLQPHVPTSDETASPRNLSTNGRKMDPRSCQNPHAFLIMTAHLRVVASTAS